MTPRAAGLRWGVGVAVSIAAHAGLWALLVRRPGGAASAPRYERVRLVEARVGDVPEPPLAPESRRVSAEGAERKRKAPPVRPSSRALSPTVSSAVTLAGAASDATDASADTGTTGEAADASDTDGATARTPSPAADGSGSSSPFPAGDPIDLSRGGLETLCGSVTIERRLLGQGFFPRRYLWTLARAGNQLFRSTSLVPVGEALPYVDTAVAKGLSRGCRPTAAALARLAPARFANGTPTTLTLRVEITDEAAVPRPPGTP